MSRARLMSIEIEGFRGFAERRRLSLDADAVVVRGDNGTGKTSLIDALLWVLCGELPHLVARAKGLRAKEDAVTNRFNRAGAKVTLEVRSNGRRVTVMRTGDQRKAPLHVAIDGAPVTDPEGALADAFGLPSFTQLTQAVPAWGILRQDHIRAALDIAGGELHERLSGIVGLDAVTAFAASSSQVAGELVRERSTLQRAQDELTARHAAAEQERAAAAATGGSAERVEETLRAGLAAIHADLGGRVRLRAEAATLEDVSRLGAAANKVLDALRILVERRKELDALPDDVNKTLRAAQAGVTAARQAVETAADAAPEPAKLAEAALALLGDNCPVCGQPIDAKSVRAHLEEVIASARNLLAGAREAQVRLGVAETHLAEATARAEKRRAAEGSLREAQAALATALDDAGGAVELDAQASAEQLAELLGDALVQLRGTYREAQEVSGAHLERLAATAAALQSEVEDGRKALQVLQRRAGDAKRLEHAAHEASKRIVERALTALQPSFAEVFDRLRPNPAFTELDVRQDIMRNKNQVVPVVRDVERGVDANPALVFSEGQLNVVALSYFLGMALNAREAALPFLVLDDPLQALDVIAILGFSDLCRRVREERQLIVTTHDRRFADVLVRKLSPRERDETLIVHDFEGWTREGPVVETKTPEMATVLPLLRRAS